MFPQIKQLLRGKALKSKKKERLFGRTDYLVQEVNLLMVMGAIPEEFVEFHYDTGMSIDYFITSFMEHFPKKSLSDNWTEVFAASIQYAVDLIKFDVAPREDVRESEDGEISALFFPTEKLGPELNMNKGKLENLLHWAYDQNPDLRGFVMYSPSKGYVVSSFFLDQLKTAGLSLDKFLKNIVGGKTKFRVT